MNHYIIRQNVEGAGQVLYNELREGRVRQGWGWRPELSLMNGEEAFVNAYAQVPGRSTQEARDRYQILRPLRGVKPGDIIIIPKQPDRSHFVLARAVAREVDGKQRVYDYLEPPPGTNDYRHVIYINDKFKICHYDSPAVPSLLKAKLRSIAYSSAVNVVGKRDVIAAIHELDASDGPTDKSEPLKSRLATLRDTMYKSWVQAARELSPSDFEKLVRLFLKAAGYSICGTCKYDGQGGDIDIDCERSFDLDDPLGAGSQTVRYLIQVKKHTGETGKKAVQQLLLHSESKESLKDGVRRVLLVISTADGFTTDCKQLARDHGVRLMNGLEFAKTYFQLVSEEPS